MIKLIYYIYIIINMPTEYLKEAVKDGFLTKKQYDKLPETLLFAIVNKKRKEQKLPIQSQNSGKKSKMKK